MHTPIPRLGGAEAGTAYPFPRLGGAEAGTAYPFPRLPQNITNWIVNLTEVEKLVYVCNTDF